MMKEAEKKYGAPVVAKERRFLSREREREREVLWLSVVGLGNGRI